MFGNVVLEIPKDAFEHELEEVKKEHGAKLDTDLTEENLRRGREALQGSRARRRPARTSRRIRSSSCAAPAMPCSARGTTPAPSSTAASTRFPTRSAPPSTCRRWCSATWAIARPPASASRATPRPAPTSSTASSWSTRRVRTSSPASARRSRSASSQNVLPKAYKELRDDHVAAREALQGHPGLRVHDPGRPALHAADAQRQAHRLRGGDDRDGPGRREADHAEGRRPAGGSRVGVAAARAGVRSEGVEGAAGRDEGAARPRRAPRPARRCSPPTTRSSGRGRGRTSSSSARRPCRTTSTACSWRRAS